MSQPSRAERIRSLWENAATATVEQYNAVYATHVQHTEHHASGPRHIEGVEAFRANVQAWVPPASGGSVRIVDYVASADGDAYAKHVFRMPLPSKEVLVIEFIQRLHWVGDRVVRSEAFADFGQAMNTLKAGKLLPPAI